MRIAAAVVVVAAAVIVGLTLPEDDGVPTPPQVPPVPAVETATSTATSTPAEPAEPAAEPEEPEPPVAFPVTDFPGLLADDWLRGGASPDVVLVVYSDLECPFCALLHARLDGIVAPYRGRVAWTLRHYPLPMHAGAMPKAIAAECIAEKAGPAAFWWFVDAAFGGEGGSRFGLSDADLAACQNGSAAAAVAREMAAGAAEGVVGTPSTVILNRGGERVLVAGAQADEAFFAAITQLLD
jgi:protein-disulfide isomerase